MRGPVIALATASALVLPSLMLTSPSAHASGCGSAVVDVPGVARVYVDDDFPVGDPGGVWIYANLDGSGNLERADSGCDNGGHDANWVF